MINDPLFFQINSDYENILEQSNAHFGDAPYTLVLLDTDNQEKKDYISSLFSNVEYINDFSDTLKVNDDNILVIDYVLNQQLKDSHNTLYIPAITKEKADALFTCFEYALERTPIAQHNIFV